MALADEDGAGAAAADEGAGELLGLTLGAVSFELLDVGVDGIGWITVVGVMDALADDGVGLEEAEGDTQDVELDAGAEEEDDTIGLGMQR